MSTTTPLTPEHESSVPIPVAPEEVAMEASDEAEQGRRFAWLYAVPAWAVSLLVHVIILLVLGLISVADPVRIVNVLSASAPAEEGPEIEEFTIEEVDPGEVAEMEEVVEPVDVAESMEMVEPEPIEPVEMASIDFEMADLAAEMAPTAASLQTLSSMTVQPLGSRSAEMKKKLLREYGGNESSEAAVTEALKWLSRHQMPNGAWTFQHHLVCNGACGNPGEPNRAKAFNAATALALLPFMGAGQTHVSGDFRQNV